MYTVVTMQTCTIKMHLGKFESLSLGDLFVNRKERSEGRRLQREREASVDYLL